LTQNEIQSLRYALEQIVQSGKFQEIANYHGAPYGEICPAQSKQLGCCKHTFEGASAEDFLTWHRLYMVQLEEAMEPYLKDTDLGLPYWDWTENEEIPEVWRYIFPQAKTTRTWTEQDYQRVTIQSNNGDITICENPTKTECNYDFSRISRGLDSDLYDFSKSSLKSYVNEALKQQNFLQFVANANSAHADIHVGLKCSMAPPQTTAYDPTFWLHHTMLDKLLSNWQFNRRNEINQRPNRFSTGRTDAFFDPQKVLAPFGYTSPNRITGYVNPYELTNISNNGTLDHYNNLCYCYDSIENCGKVFDFDPFLQKEIQTPQIPECSSYRAVRDQFCGVEKICERSIGVIFESTFEEVIGDPIFKLSVSVGFVIPIGLGGMSISYTLCELDDGSPGRCFDRNGKLALFGGSQDVKSTNPVTSEFYSVRTSLVYHEDVNSDQDTFKWKSLQVKTFEDSLPILAPPFVIVTISNGRQEFSYAELQPGIEEEAYGDLLDSYSEVVAFGTYQIDGL